MSTHRGWLCAWCWQQSARAEEHWGVEDPVAAWACFKYAKFVLLIIRGMPDAGAGDRVRNQINLAIGTGWTGGAARQP